MYKDKDVKELLELLHKHEALTFQSQLNLQRELVARGLSKEATALDNTVVKTSTDIHNFEYLKDLGFKFEEAGNSLKITRTIQAIITDIAAIVLGLFLSLYGFIKLLGITVFSHQDDDTISLSALMMMVVYGAMILLGVKFLSGVKRFFDFLGFELSKSDEGIILKKRFDLTLEERQVEASDLKLERYKDRLILKLDDDDLLDSNANDIIQEMTIESLYHKLKS